MKGQLLVNEQLKLIDESVSDFVDGLPVTERAVFDNVMKLVKQLELNGDTIVSNTANVRLVAKIKAELESIVLNDKYLEKVDGFVKAFDKVSAVNRDYFATIAVNYSPEKVVEQVKKLNIETTIEDLTQQGIGAAYTDGIRDLLVTNVTSGARYEDLVGSLRDYIIGKDGEDGTMVRYAKQIATDSLNQYNGQYIKTVTDDLGLEWYMYVGSNLRTTRPFCKAMTELLYFHKSEIPDIIRGNINGKKVSLAGVSKDTTAQNFFTLRGGYNCGHQIYPVLTSVVPESVRARVVKN